MKSKRLFNTLSTMALFSTFVIQGAACSALTGDTGSDSGSAASDESDVEAAVTGAVDSLNQTVNSSSSEDSASIAALMKNGTAYSTTSSGVANLRRRIHCEDEEDSSDVLTCETVDGVLTGNATRVVTFADCEVTGTYRDIELNGSFTNTIENGGDGFCDEDSNVVDFSKLVMGNDSGDAVHSHATGDDGMIFTFTNERGHEVTITETASDTVTYTDAVDTDEDGSADTVTATVSRTEHVEHVIGDRTAHDIDVFNTDTDFTSTDSDGDATTIEVALPVHTLTFDDDGELETRTIESGNLIVDHNLAKVRLVFGVGENGLTFNAHDGSCGPVSGTMTFTGYTINDDGSIGGEIGSGTITFEDGDVDSASFDGDRLDIRPRPCH